MSFLLSCSKFFIGTIALWMPFWSTCAEQLQKTSISRMAAGKHPHSMCLQAFALHNMAKCGAVMSGCDIPILVCRQLDSKCLQAFALHITAHNGTRVSCCNTDILRRLAALLTIASRAFLSIASACSKCFCRNSFSVINVRALLLRV